MLTAIIKGFIDLASFFIDLMPTFDARLPDGILDLLSDVFNGIGYFIPSSAWIILGITVSFYGFIFAYNVLAEIKNWTPIIF